MTSATCCRSVVLGAVCPLASATATWRGSFLTSVALKMKLCWTYLSSDNYMSCSALYINALKKPSLLVSGLLHGLEVVTIRAAWLDYSSTLCHHSQCSPRSTPPNNDQSLGLFWAPININICAHFCFVSSFWNIWLFPVFLSQVEFHPKTQNSSSEHFGWRYAALEEWFKTSPGCQAAPCAVISQRWVQRGSLGWRSGDLGHLTHGLPGTVASSDWICMHFSFIIPYLSLVLSFQEGFSAAKKKINPLKVEWEVIDQHFRICIRTNFGDLFLNTVTSCNWVSPLSTHL